MRGEQQMVISEKDDVHGDHKNQQKDFSFFIYFAVINVQYERAEQN